MRIRSRWLTWMLGAAGGTVFQALSRSLSIDVVFEEPRDPLDPQLTPLAYCLWHDAILLPLASRVRWRPPRDIYALVSRHQDGSYLSAFMQQVGVQAVRGSTSHGGAEALRRLMEVGQSGHVYITPDGPRGPRREIKPGIIFLASQTGLAVVPVGSAASAGWRIQGSWTDLFVPRPYTRAAVVFGKALHVPPGLPKDSIAGYQRLLTAEMGRVEQVAEGVVRGEQPSECAIRLVA